MQLKIFQTILVIFSPVMAAAATAQDETRTDVMTAIEHFTETLNILDADAARTVMEPTASIILSVKNEDGTVRHVIRSRDEYLATWDQLGGSTLEEKMWNPVIQTDGTIATVWMDYELYVNGEFRQCGKNGFNMIRRDDGWKMAGAVSSVQRTGCSQTAR